MKRRFLAASVIATPIIILCCFLSFDKFSDRKTTDSQTVTETISIADDSEDEIAIDDQSADIKNVENGTNSEEDPNVESPGYVYISDEDPYVGAVDTVETDAEDPYIGPYVTDNMYGIFENQIDIYNSVALNQFLGEKHITIDDINEAVDNNANLDDQWKDIIKEFAGRIISEYPEVDMRLFYENVKRLEIEYNSKEHFQEKGEDAYYNYEEGVIHVQENIDFINDSYNLMMIRHEIGHMISLGILKGKSGKKIVCITKNGGYGEYLTEAIDVYISSKPYEQEYDFTDCGYSINANELEAVIDAIPDFDISVLANRDVYEIADYLDEINPNPVSASEFISLMDQQTIDYYDTSNNEEVQKDFSDIYRYIANTYVNHVLNENMSREEIQQVSDDIKEDLGKSINYYYLYKCDGYEEIDKVFDEFYNENQMVEGN